MTLLRGRGTGLDVMFAGRDFPEALSELRARLAEQPGFYRGCAATAVFGDDVPGADQLSELRAVLESAGLTYAGETRVEAELERRRAMRPKRELKLSDSARTLVADFAGARADIAERRKRGETSVRRTHQHGSKAAAPPQAILVPQETLYHVGTLRGGQALHHSGNIVVVGDVNPGTELVATGDIVVFGRLLGVAHAGAQGDAAAKVYALELRPTQLRIAAVIAADERNPSASRDPEVAAVREGRITIVPFDKSGELLA